MIVIIGIFPKNPTPPDRIGYFEGFNPIRFNRLLDVIIWHFLLSELAVVYAGHDDVGMSLADFISQGLKPSNGREDWMMW